MGSVLDWWMKQGFQLLAGLYINISIILVLVLTALPLSAEEPVLPSGLESTDEPVLPPGLGLNQPTVVTTTEENTIQAFQGFTESRAGMRTQNDPQQKRASIGELRWQLKSVQELDWLTLNFTVDFIFDPVMDEQHISLENGDGWIDLRETNILLRPTDSVDIKVGRQILTWGTGDLVFINDLFPKDWNSFLIGRDDEYLKAPSDAIKTSWFRDKINLDVILSPSFDSDRFIDGRRVSYFLTSENQIAGRDFSLRTVRTTKPELAARIYGFRNSFEMAGYYYSGAWKSPAGFDTDRQKYTFPDLEVFGASIRGPVGPGLFSSEAGFYRSKEDRRGDNPFIKNSEWRILLGYEQELVPELTGNIQYYVEAMQDYNRYLDSLPEQSNVAEHYRQVATFRLTQRLQDQRLTLSLFNFWSPSDRDGYVRLNAQYQYTDQWRFEAGINQLYGDTNTTFFGQLKSNSNVYVAIRYGF